MYKLMIVDDNNVQLNYLTSCVLYEELGISEVKTAMDGEEGLILYNEFKPDIVITDVEMPKTDGVCMMKKIKALNDKCKFIFISCYDDFNYIKEAMDNNAASYILKPVDTDALVMHLKKAIEEIKKENDFFEMNRILGESLEAFRENFLYRFLHSSHIDKNSLKNTIKNLGFEKYKEFLLAVIDFEGKTDVYNFLATVKANLFNEIEGNAVVESDNRCVVVFMNENYGDFKEKTKNVLGEFSENMVKREGIYLNIGLSGISKNLYDVKYMLSQAAGVLEGKIFLLENGIYEYEEDNFSNEPECDIAEFYDSVSYILDSANEEDIEAFIKKYYDNCTNVHYIKKLCVSVVSTLHLVLTERGININELYITSSALWDKLDRFETIVDTRRWLFNILKAAMDFLNDNENSRYKRIVSDIIENINVNYASVSNVNDVIKELYISASYAQSLFKKYTGKTISDYVIEKRMEEAKKLLSDPYVKVYEVAEKVGYKSKAHFSEIFKKSTGMTPKEFRQTQ